MTPDVTVGVLALQGDVREHMQRLRELSVSAVAVTSPAQLGEINGLVLPGGESTTMSILARREGFLAPLREYRAAGGPCFGSCAGLIMLADELIDGRPDQETIGGLSIAVRRNAFGRQVDSFETNVQMPVLGEEPFPAVFIRAPWVESVADNVEVLASNHKTGAIIAVREGSVLAVSFHPELTRDLRLHRYFVDIITEQI